MRTNVYSSRCSSKEKERIIRLCENNNIYFIARRYHVSVRSIYRWKSLYNGSIESLNNKSSKPHHSPKEQSIEEKTNIGNLIKRNPNISLNELYGKLRTNYGYSRNIVTLYRYLRKIGYFIDLSKTRNNHIPKTYDTPDGIGEKMQLDVKYVPRECILTGKGYNPFDLNFYQYTIIDEATRERFIYPYKEQCAWSTCDFIRRAILYFGYIPKVIQTDNGQEFTYIKQSKEDKLHPFDVLCNELGIEHKLIKPRTPRHNGKVERSHRSDNERFYKFLKFYSYDDLKKQMKAYLKRSNNIPTSVLKWKTPLDKRAELLLRDYAIVETKKRIKNFVIKTNDDSFNCLVKNV
ncbi:MAG: transposase [Bacilli bacterium]|nr:transposase [Bacilli bacterium]